LAETVFAALARPAVALALGRRSCPPSVPVHVPGGLVDDGLETVLARWPVADPARADSGTAGLRIALECPLPEADYIQPDQPLGRAFSERTFLARGVRVVHVPVPSTSNSSA